MNYFEKTAGVLIVLCIFQAEISVPAVLAEPVVKEKYQYYKIDGHSSEDLAKELGRHGNIFSGAAFDARTQWKVEWKFKFSHSADGCGIRSVKTFLYLTITLPQWSNEKSADRYFQVRWKEYSAALIKHEHGHKDLGIRTANAIEKELLNLSPAAGCSQMGQIANQTAGHIVDQYNEKQRLYDEVTDHGKKQGAVFP